VVIHAVVLLAVLGVLHRRVKLVAYGLPGTKVGTQFLTYYAPGSAKLSQNDLAAKVVEKKAAASVVHSPVAPPKPEVATAQSSERGTGAADESGLGNGNITIALEKYFPYPKPSLSSLPHGTVGDVILHAVIDEHGRVAELTVLQGLSPEIDKEVMETVNRWVYTPATRNGVPVPSVEELHFHYEQRG
jgi:protein TonB